jgi:hypothetical protein
VALISLALSSAMAAAAGVMAALGQNNNRENGVAILAKIKRNENKPIWRRNISHQRIGAITGENSGVAAWRNVEMAAA